MDKNKGPLEKVINVIMWIASLSIIFVLGYLFYNSFRTKSDVMTNTLGKPTGFTAENYIRVFVNESFARYFMNSIIILFFAVVLLVFLSSFVAYGLGRYKFRGNKFLRIFFLIGMMFPVQLGIVPIFLMIKGVGLIDSYVSVILILGTAISMPVLMLTEFFSKLPNEIYEAATLDGAGELTIFFRIMFPMAQPVIFSVCLISSVSIWNQFFIPLVFLQSDAKKTVPQLVVKFTGNLFNNMDSALAASVLSTIPILLLFVFFSKKVLSGFMGGAVKG
ncbi:carbohydrate ABC transporter permease [Vagococcus carniphilus]|uniref:carbohydrate ABC transporter permease n=1 Tax=Vagococcus carniphilus TaxID=218144 RepID=UPI002890AC40|nr:carbohydrate ABC transporter permease [Vagococcus carniphilus]MDT2830958.1 carbohydrate ABC transporter permease [Vagococcus carniphilus]MDT2838145.1 carbohydrate ABC transporter permease [Vagococcus carniphilus]MDT2853694.1 carbohydrate ABC transporter permease [Vagococcus carniphilus]